MFDPKKLEHFLDSLQVETLYPSHYPSGAPKMAHSLPLDDLMDKYDVATGKLQSQPRNAGVSGLWTGAYQSSFLVAGGSVCHLRHASAASASAAQQWPIALCSGHRHSRISTFPESSCSYRNSSRSSQGPVGQALGRSARQDRNPRSSGAFSFA